MDDIVWYSRFAVLVGALVLLVQAISGRGAGFVTLIGVLLLTVGLVVFVIALGMQGLRSNRVTEPEAPLLESEELPTAEVTSEPAPQEVRPQTDHRETVSESADEPAVKE